MRTTFHPWWQPEWTQIARKQKPWENQQSGSPSQVASLWHSWNRSRETPDPGLPPSEGRFPYIDQPKRDLPWEIAEQRYVPVRAKAQLGPHCCPLGKAPLPPCWISRKYIKLLAEANKNVLCQNDTFPGIKIYMRTLFMKAALFLHQWVTAFFSQVAVDFIKGTAILCVKNPLTVCYRQINVSVHSGNSN